MSKFTMKEVIGLKLSRTIKSLDEIHSSSSEIRGCLAIVKSLMWLLLAAEERRSGIIKNADNLSNEFFSIKVKQLCILVNEWIPDNVHFRRMVKLCRHISCFGFNSQRTRVRKTVDSKSSYQFDLTFLYKYTRTSTRLLYSFSWLILIPRSLTTKTKTF